MKENLNSQKYTAQAKALYKEALEATIALLKANGKNRYIVMPDGNDGVNTFSEAREGDIPVCIWGVGLNDEDHICIKAVVDPEYTGFDDYPEGWVDIKYILNSSYPDIYRFVVDNLEAATDKVTADEAKWEFEDDEDDEDWEDDEDDEDWEDED